MDEDILNYIQFLLLGGRWECFLEVLSLGYRRCKKDAWCKAPLQIVLVNVSYGLRVLYCTSGLDFFFFNVEVCYFPFVFF